MFVVHMYTMNNKLSVALNIKTHLACTFEHPLSLLNIIQQIARSCNFFYVIATIIANRVSAHHGNCSKETSVAILDSYDIYFHFTK